MPRQSPSWDYILMDLPVLRLKAANRLTPLDGGVSIPLVSPVLRSTVPRHITLRMSGRNAISPEIAKQEAILHEAVRTFARVGFRNADVQAIADGAGVGKGTVYRYFNSKEALFWAACLSVLKRAEGDLYRAVAETEGALNKLRASALAFARFYDSHPELIEILVLERSEFRGSIPPSHMEYHEKLIRTFMEILENGVQAGEIRTVNPRKTIDSLANLLYGTIVSYCYVKDRVALTEIAEYAVDIFFQGIRLAAPAASDE